MNEPDKPDHRTRVAVERRERTRARLVQSALAVFAEKGVGASVIQDVIAAAGVSQGTFYNYFRTNEDLLFAVAEELSNELVDAIEHEVARVRDPAARIANGVRLYLDRAQAFPLFGRFVVRAGLQMMRPGNLVYDFVPQHLEEGFLSGRLLRMPVEVALDMIGGQTLLAVARLASGTAPPRYCESVIEALLRGLGVPTPEAKRIASAPMHPMPVAESSLLVRSTACVQT